MRVVYLVSSCEIGEREFTRVVWMGGKGNNQIVLVFHSIGWQECESMVLVLVLVLRVKEEDAVRGGLRGGGKILGGGVLDASLYLQ